MLLKAIDLSLMAEHLNTHRGVINKLEIYYCSVQLPALKEVIYEQDLIMRNHIKVMILLMDPDVNEAITADYLHHLDPFTIYCQNNPLINQENAALELKNTAQTMALSNFQSALRMQAQNVRDIHIQMSLQQTSFQQRYQVILDENNWEIAPESTLQQQKNTLQSFKKIFKIPN